MVRPSLTPSTSATTSSSPGSYARRLDVRRAGLDVDVEQVDLAVAGDESPSARSGRSCCTAGPGRRSTGQGTREILQSRRRDDFREATGRGPGWPRRGASRHRRGTGGTREARPTGHHRTPPCRRARRPWPRWPQGRVPRRAGPGDTERAMARTVRRARSRRQGRRDARDQGRHVRVVERGAVDLERGKESSLPYR